MSFLGLSNTDESTPQIGYIVSELIVSSPSRGTYKVWIPKRHWTPGEEYAGFGANFCNLGESERQMALNSAEECYPCFPLQAGGAKPYDPSSGVVSHSEANPDINPDNVASITSAGKIDYKKIYHPDGDGANFKFRQTEGADELSQVYVFGARSGVSSNTRTNAPGGSMAKLSIGTRVVVIGNFIIGMLPETQNDWINQFFALNKSK